MWWNIADVCRASIADIPLICRNMPHNHSVPDRQSATESSPRIADVVICGAGIAGIAVAHALCVSRGIRNVLLVDERAPLTLTSDKSTEAYRNWWPGPDGHMIAFMNRNVDMLEEIADATSNRIRLNRRGYLYTTQNPGKAEQFREIAQVAARQGAGSVREYHSAAEADAYQPCRDNDYRNAPSGADILMDRESIQRYFPWLSADIVAVLHARRCGWFSGQQLGMHLLDEAKSNGMQFVNARVTDVEVIANRVAAVTITNADGSSSKISTTVFVNAAGPFAAEIASLVDVKLPLFSELHLKMSFEDELRIVDRNTGLVILDDIQTLEWTDDERSDLASDPSTRWMTEPMPAGVHLRPDGGPGSKTVLMLWDYHSSNRYSDAVFPLPEDPHYAEFVMRGMTRLAPGLGRYVERLPHSVVDGGYYTKTEENRPLIGPLAVDGAYVCAAFSGFGLMAAPAAGELIAEYISGGNLPSYAAAFRPDRYDRPEYREMLSRWTSTGQL